MGYITSTMTNNEIGAGIKVADKTDYMVGLYRRFAADLLRVRQYQKTVRPRLIGWCMFDDIDAEVLYLVLRDLKPDVSVEISAGNGWSTSWHLNALKDNGKGMLSSFDIHDASVRGLPLELTRGRWKFFLGDIHQRVSDVPAKLDFLMMDSEHTDTFCDWFVPTFFPRVRPGGKIVAHDIFMLRTPAHGDAISTFRYVDKNGIEPYAFGQVFPEFYSKIAAVRREIGIPDGDMVFKNECNSLLLIDVPEGK